MLSATKSPLPTHQHDGLTAFGEKQNTAPLTLRPGQTVYLAVSYPSTAQVGPSCPEAHYLAVTTGQGGASLTVPDVLAPCQGDIEVSPFLEHRV